MTIENMQAFTSSLRSYWICDGRDSEVGKDLLNYLRHPNAKINEMEFKSHLANAINCEMFSAEEYEKLTGNSFDTKKEVTDDLKVLWKIIFKDEPIVASSSI